MNFLIIIFNNQGSIGIIVCLLILLSTILGVLMSKKSKEFYMGKYNNLISRIGKEEDYKFNDAILEAATEDFIASAMNGVENINTEVIIEKNIPSNIMTLESNAKFLAPMCTALGLLGTFLGLTMAISQIKIGNAAEFVPSLRQPIQSMGAAFMTSIFGVIGSMILNAVNNVMRLNKESFYAEFEHYLDNEVYSEYGHTSNDVMENLAKEYVKSLMKNMELLFDEGIDKLVNKINVSNIDLTNSSKELQRVVAKLDKVVNKFSEPVSDFKETISDFECISQELTDNFKDNVSMFIDQVQGLEDKFKVLNNNLDNNKNAIEKIGVSFIEQSKNMSDSHTKFISSLDNLQETSRVQTQNINKQLDDVKSTYNRFMEELDQFQKVVAELSKDVPKQLSQVLKDETESTNSKIVKELTQSCKGIKEAVEELANSANIIGKLTKGADNLASRTIETNHLKGSEQLNEI